jgi:prevent-host-death family protein
VYTSTMRKGPQGSEALEVGVRSFRADLRRWLEIAAERDVVITDRGTPVARLVPIGRHPGLDQLVAEGAVTFPERPATASDAWAPVRPRRSISDLVAEQRR